MDEYEYILNYTNIKPLDYLQTFAIKEDKDRNEINVDTESTIYTCEYYLKKTNDFETLIDILLHKINVFDARELFDKDFMVLHYSDYFGKDKDSIYTLALKYGNNSVFDYLCKKYIIGEDNKNKIKDEKMLYYKNKAGKSIFDYLLTNSEEYNSINELLFYGFDDVIYKKYDLNQYYHPDNDFYELRKYYHSVYLLKDCELMTPYNYPIILDKFTKVNVKYYLPNIALDGKDGKKHCLYYVSIDNGVGGFLSSEYFVENLVKVENNVESQEEVIDSSYFYVDYYSYVIQIYNFEGDLVKFYKYDDEANLFEKIDNFYEIPKPTRIINYGNRKIEGTVYSCLEFRYTYSKELGELLEHTWFILYDKKKNEAYIVFDSNFDNFFKYDEFSLFQPSKIDWLDSMIIVEGDEFDREFEFVKKLHFKISKINEFYYQLDKIQYK